MNLLLFSIGRHKIKFHVNLTTEGAPGFRIVTLHIMPVGLDNKFAGRVLFGSQKNEGKMKEI